MIEVGRNSIVVRNVDFNSKEFKRINANFSLYDKVKHKYVFSAFTIIDTDLYFPATIGESTIHSYFPTKEISYNYKTTAKADRITFAMKHQPRDDLQVQALKFLEKLKKDNKQRSRFLSLNTGTGKTYITINFISTLGKKPLIIVDTLDLAAQWKREFMKHGELTENDIIILSGQDIVNKQQKNPTGKIYIAIHRTLGNMLTEDTNSVNILMNKLKIGIRVFDESHVDFGNICRINSLSNVEYTLYLTATPNRSNFNDDSLYGKVFRNVPYFNGKELDQEKYHTVVLYPMNSHPTLDVKAGIRTKYGFSSPKWASYINDDAYDTLLETVEDILKTFKLEERKKKTVIMLPTIELIKKLQKDLSENHPGLEIGTFIGEVRKDKRIEELAKPLILTNDKIFDKAIDVKDLEVLINFVQLGSAVKTEQIIGRLRYNKGKSSILIDVTDYGFEECVKQFKLRRRFYKKKAKKIIEIKK